MVLAVIAVLVGFAVGWIRVSPETVTASLNGPGGRAASPMRAKTGDTVQVVNHGRHSCLLRGRPHATTKIPPGGRVSFVVADAGDYTMRCGSGKSAVIHLHVEDMLTLSESPSGT